MTISSTTSEVSYAGNGVTLAFDIPFVFDTSADLLVYEQVVSTGIITQRTTGIVVSGGDGSTGTLTYSVAPPTGTNITILDNPERTQTHDYVENDPFPAESHEGALDKLTRLAKRLYQTSLKSLRIADGDAYTSMVLPTKVGRASKFLAFDANGNPIASAAVSDGDALLRAELIAGASSLVNSTGIKYAITDAEIDAGVTPVNYYYEPGYIYRYGTLANAIAATAGSLLIFSSGTYNITTNVDFATTILKFLPGASLNVTAGVNVTIRNQIDAGNYRIFSTTGNIMCAGRVNPMWWGATPTINNVSTPNGAANNTLAFRRAAKSFFSDYNLIAGSIASPGNGLPFSVCIPAGVWDLSNGFSAAVGIKVSGDSSSITLIRRLIANYDSDIAIPLLTIGQTLAAAPGLAYQNDATAGQSLSPFTAAGAGESAAMASDIYFIDQNPTVAAFAPRYPGVQFHDLFFTSCGIAIDLSNSADITGNNIIIDMGLTAISMSNCQNIRLSGVILYDQVAQAIAVGSNIYDCSIDAQIEYPQGIAINIAGSNIQNLKFPNLNITQNASTGVNQIIVAASVSNVEIDFPNMEVRNLGNCAAIVIGASTTNTILRFKSPTFDGNRTNTVYNQNTNMQAFAVSSGTVIIEDSEMRNMGVRSIFVNTASLIVRGLRYIGMGTAGSLFDLSGCTGGDAEFFDIHGDGATPLLTNAAGSATIRVKSSSDWLGSAFADGAFYSWYVPLPGAGQLMATISANTDGTANLRKSATVLYEVSVEVLPAITQTITSTTLFASAIANGHPQVAPSLVFSGNTTTQVVTSVSPTVGKLRVPNTYNAPIMANVEYMA